MGGYPFFYLYGHRFPNPYVYHPIRLLTLVFSFVVFSHEKDEGIENGSVGRTDGAISYGSHCVFVVSGYPFTVYILKPIK